MAMAGWAAASRRWMTMRFAGARESGGGWTPGTLTIRYVCTTGHLFPFDPPWPCSPRCSRTARLAPLHRQAADLSTDIAQRCCGQQRPSHHLLPPALPPRPHCPHQAAVPPCACAAPCKADRGAAARACLAPAREPLSGADGSPRVRRRLLVPAAARRAAPLREHRKQQPAAREERGAGLVSKRNIGLMIRNIGLGYGARASASPRTLSGTETALEYGEPPRANHASPREAGAASCRAQNGAFNLQPHAS
jgi:hypothetical protein